MNSNRRAEIRDEVAAHAEEVFAGVESRWDDVPRLEPLTVEPLPDDEASFPESDDEFFDRFYPYAAGAAVTDDEGRLLCVYSPVRDEWETPGGAGESGERPAETACRETREETGVECELTGVLQTRLMELDLGEPELLPIPVVEFTGRVAGGEELAGDEIDAHGGVSDLDWFGPDELPSHVREYEQKVAHLRSLDRREK
ncbi:NUDIX domain-containing protein [Halorussus gelatinilyticus]|uniref:NUDIX domain-containing protein n=1 Tax=Halorussus gelatinilyticus TaxID=2937524 RepID=A0A8U0IN80_9EURY|nr:NUDIX domain-containing protein [Halorussus gelatinilyticus]UPW01902.1 NUDIX domain-containing protein [Halorussus gelatinilyticus]